MIKYSEEHQWIKACDNGIWEVGITAYAAEELGELNFVELPKVGDEFAGGQPLCVVESVKAASDVFAPVSGTVTEVNLALEKNPALLNESPEEAGWICRFKDVDPTELDALMDRPAYEAYCQQNG
ncbi:MAG: glycine cleavage system protein GcvH [Lentisphaeria bacterium]|jgi:glycine cleavage system H protein|nr:glycine cleavage system protein GcvH [Lentisphaeria bacterium]